MTDMKGRKQEDGDVLLDPCPFCGKVSELIITSSYDDEEDNSNDESYTVVCDASTDNKEMGCGASCGFKPTKGMAALEWNTRTKLN